MFMSCTSLYKPRIFTMRHVWVEGTYVRVLGNAGWVQYLLRSVLLRAMFLREDRRSIRTKLGRPLCRQLQRGMRLVHTVGRVLP
jgi:hypothetical protein